MGGAIDEEIVVERDGQRLVAFLWQGQRYVVTSAQVLGTPPTRWWEGQGERTYVQVVTRGRLYEIYFDHERGVWIVAGKLS